MKLEIFKISIRVATRISTSVPSLILLYEKGRGYFIGALRAKPLERQYKTEQSEVLIQALKVKMLEK
ncbi:hypothetical protein LFLEISCH_09789 [Listeria fleischmannii subsp. fleischmannii LU2006-1]|nr:hypothetical protein LFLEISCH_09789 [Listeria fleischmannii subsp. fleischmannii LU2006-1]